jgi:dolichyl-phosphate beta-glucosyltransferase
VPQPDLSIILPSYRGAEEAARSVGALEELLPATDLTWELLVVDDGGGDFPPGDWRPGGARPRLIRLPGNRGKGAAVRAGMLAASGQVRVYTDIDLPFGASTLPLIVALVRERGFHMVVGDRTLSESSYHLEVGWRRRLASSLFSVFVGRVVTGGFFDTQCGLKGFRGDVADRLFRLARIDRFAFDVELIYLALHHRLDVKRIPVRLERNVTSSVRIGRDSLRMLLDVARIKLLQLRGRYDDPVLAELPLRDLREMGGRAGLNGPASERVG